MVRNKSRWNPADKSAQPVAPRRFLHRFVEPELLQPFLFFSLVAITCSEFVRSSLVLSVLPTYGRTVLGFAVEWTGLALSVHYIVDNVLRVPVGWVIDRVGGRTLLIIGFSIGIVAIFWMMNAHQIWSLIGSMGLLGFAVTPMWPSAIATIGKSTPESKRAAFMGYLYMFWLAGMGIGPVIMGFLWSKTYHLAFLVLMAVLIAGLVCVLIFVRMPVGLRGNQGGLAGWAAPEPAVTDGEQPRGHREREVSALGERQMVVHEQGRGQNPGLTQGSDEPLQRPSLRLRRHDLHALWHHIRTVSFLIPGMFVQTFAVSCIVPILSLYAKVVLHLSGPMYSLLLACAGVVTIIGLIPAGRLVDAYGSRRFLVSGFVLGGIAMGIYPIFQSIVATYIFVAVFGVTYAFILPSWNTVLDRNIDPDRKATLWGVFMTIEGLGSAVGAFVGGFVWDHFSPKAPFYVAAVIIVAMGILYGWMPIGRRR
ncbi:MFS transporter [Alicyclobacillus dauci]|uniref:MFS transporter n=1 Tax=Alicyclobacillus dauci TaxID=1475485 RepID=A0ABY6Z214_9BACL|nr:MFS transporter [Alicyclobacillus dauci]WAH36871.1 MFS transporter [Alicyclobacillus dauci]